MSCPMCPRWEEDTDQRIIELEQSYVILNRDQFFPGYTLLFTKQHVTELFHLEERARRVLMDEVSIVAAALATVYQPTKINYELLGNMVPHIHWHLVPRFDDDPLWPQPIWSRPHDERLLLPEGYRQKADLIRRALQLATGG